MKTLTAKEEEIMGFFWEKGPMFVKQLVELYEEPRPHFNTLSTIVRGLEEKGYLSHTAFGNTYQYHAIVSEEEFRRKTLRGVISKYFNNSFLGAVSSLVKEEDIFSGRTQRTHPSGGRGAERETTIKHVCLWEPF